VSPSEKGTPLLHPEGNARSGVLPSVNTNRNLRALESYSKKKRLVPFTGGDPQPQQEKGSAIRLKMAIELGHVG